MSITVTIAVPEIVPYRDERTGKQEPYMKTLDAEIFNAIEDAEARYAPEHYHLHQVVPCTFAGKEYLILVLEERPCCEQCADYREAMVDGDALRRYTHGVQPPTALRWDEVRQAHAEHEYKRRLGRTTKKE